MEKFRKRDIMQFGKYTWRVLDISDNGDMALIIAAEPLENREFHNKCEPVDWLSSDLRKYLNNEFWNSFTDSEKERIVPVILPEYTDNQHHNATATPTTEDKIFLLSTDEALAYRLAKDAIDLTDEGKGQWWLRSGGWHSDTAVTVIACRRTIIGKIDLHGEDVDSIYGVRPALWLKLKQ